MTRTLLILLLTCAGLAGQEDPTEPKLQPPVKSGMKYYVSRPKGWNSSRKWPVVMTIDGAGQNWEGNAKSFANARKEMPFIIITPITLRMGPLEKRVYAQSIFDRIGDDYEKLHDFDRKGMFAVAREVAKKYSGEEKFFITGFSAGGHTAWMMTFMYPDKLAGVGIAAGNYDGRGVGKVSTSAARSTLRIKEFLGSKDAYLKNLLPQWNKAKEAAEEYGFKNLELEMVEGRPHNAFPAEVLGYFNSLLK